MKLIAINGSPRKRWNTATLLNHAVEGAASQGAETELIHLYNYNYKGCISCFACKLKDGKSYGHCAVQDDLAPILKKIAEADAMIIGSPIYFGDVTGEVRSFLERLLFQYLVYDRNYSSLFPKKMPIGFIYTMNVNQSMFETAGYQQRLKPMEQAVERTLGTTESMFVMDTYQFDDYSKYVVTSFSGEEKARRRKEIFPQDCQQAFVMGAKFAKHSG